MPSPYRHFPSQKKSSFFLKPLLHIYTYLPENATVQTVQWSVHPTDVVALADNGEGSCTVKALKAGGATVTAATTDGGYSATCTVESDVYISDLNFITKVGNKCEWQKESDGTIKLMKANLEAIQKVTQLLLDGSSSDELTDPSDIRRFTALQTLACCNNQLTKLDLSDNTALTSLSCYSNRLTALDISNNENLES